MREDAPIDRASRRGRTYQRRYSLKLTPSPRARRLIGLCAGLVMFAAANAQDVPGGPTPPLVTRYQGSHLVAWQTEAFASVVLPTAYDRNGGKWTQSQTVEGQRQRFVFLAPAGKTALEVQRNYEAALASAGGAKALACSANDHCANDVADLRGDYTSWLSDPALRTKAPAAFDAVNGSGNLYHAIYKVDRGGATTWVSVLSVDGARQGTATVLDFVQPKALEGGKVALASAAAIEAGLKAEGKMALYGVNFDTGKASLRPDARPQLAEMAKILKAQPALKVLIVGHTDNVGDFASNIALSQHRAEAIVAALSHDYGIAAGRMRPFGDANAAPLASNENEAGRARNRRVELVVQ
jgi:outer membrane protein OmpA-like peptidoglycan-associated protein